MSKQIKILLILLIMAVLLVLYFIVTSKPVARIQVKNQVNAVVDLEKLAADYKKDVKSILDSYLLLIEDADVNAAQIQIIKRQLLELKVPTEFKDMHLDFVLAITKMEEFLQDGNKEARVESGEMVDKVRDDLGEL